MSRFDGEHMIKDSVHGYIRLTDEERDILDTRPVQRLRRVSQMGMSSLVYPGATHSRFMHSVGVMHVAGEFADSLGLSDREYRTLRIAGLIHDVGHGPFSHASDRVAQRYGYTHEERSCEILDEELADVVPRDISISDIKDQILGRADLNIIAGDIDADRIDYLNRDAINTGIGYGTIDNESIIEFARLEEGRIVFDRKATFALTELLTARLYMHNAIMNHHLSRLAETMLERCLQMYVEENSVRDMMSKDDYTMHYELLNADKDRISDLYDRVISRELLKRAYTIRGNEVPIDVIQRLSDIDAQEFERRIAERAGLDTTDVVIVTPAVPRSNPSNICMYDYGSVVQLSNLTEIPDQLQKERARQTRFHVYSKEGCVETVSDVADSVFADILDG